MKRDAISQLYRWKANPNRKPLILRGARQVGKTWLMKKFATEAYDKYVYINFEENEFVKNIFKNDFNIERILLAFQVATNTVIDKGTLIILDEIQEAPRGITVLKYFQENAPEYHIIVAGSLLGISMHKNESFPVGKVDFLNLYPLSFTEFLNASGEEKLAELINQRDWEMISVFNSRLQEYLRQYFYIGGMPEVIASFLENKDFMGLRRIQQQILDSYDNDFSKHAPITEVPRIRMIWKSIPTQLSKENRKFIYGLIKEGSRAKEFELAIEWLQDAGLLYKINRCKKAMLPLNAYEDFSAFKLFMVDTGLMCAMSNVPVNALLEGNSLFTDYKGALAEQYVLQQLKAISNLSIFYWSADNSRGEIDFLIQSEDVIIPIEVKAEDNLQSKSLRTFIEKNDNLSGVRFSMSAYREQSWLTNYPLYSVSALRKITKL